MHSCSAGSPPGDLLFSCFRDFCVLHGALSVFPYLVWSAWVMLSCVGWIWPRSLGIEAQGLLCGSSRTSQEWDGVLA